ncbi:MAG: DciA family protein [Acidimicrobiales bacterium]
MRRKREEPATLGDILNVVAGRLKRVDIRLIDQVRVIWDNTVDEALRDRCHPLFIKDGVLVVEVPSGAFAQRITQDGPRILVAFESLGTDAPRSIRPVIAS